MSDSATLPNALRDTYATEPDQPDIATANIVSNHTESIANTTNNNNNVIFAFLSSVTRPQSAVILGNLAPIITEADLHESLDACGTILSARIGAHPLTNERLCVMEFESEAGADAAMIVGGLAVTLGDKILTVQKFETFQQQLEASMAAAATAVPVTTGSQSAAQQLLSSIAVPQAVPMMVPVLPLAALPSHSSTIYVGNLSPSVSEDILRLYFSQLGPLTAVRLQADSNSPNRYAFVEFLHHDTAKQALQLHGQMLMERTMKIGPAQNNCAGNAKPGLLAQITAVAAAPQVDSILSKVNELAEQSGVDANKVTSALAKVAEAQRQLAMKLGVGVQAPLPIIPTPTNKTETDNARAVVNGARSRDSKSKTESRSRSTSRSRSRSRSRSPRNRSSSRHKSSRRRSRSRSDSRDRPSRSRRHRSRSRSRSPSPHHRSRRSHSSRYDRYERRRSPSRSPPRRSNGRAPYKNVPRGGNGRYFDGFQWREEGEPASTAQQPAS